MDPITIIPDPRFRTKIKVISLIVFTGAFFWWSIPLAYIAGHELGGIALGVILTAAGHIAVIGLTLWLADLYYDSIRYEIHEDEVVVIIGIVTKSVKHVPFRTVTNLKVTRGPFDRLFGLGSLAIQTAGMSGSTGAEENLEGLVDVQSVYMQVAKELRRFRGAMSPTQSGDEVAAPLSSGEAGVLTEILGELRAIRAKMDAA